MPLCLALNPRLTSWLVRPFTSLEAQAGNHENVRITVHEALVGRVLGPPQQGKKILCLARVGGPHDQGIEGQVSGIHASLYLCVNPRVCPGFVCVCAPSLCVSGVCLVCVCLWRCA